MTGLTAADFEVEDNGVAQAVSLADPNARFNLILALDTSATVQGTPLRDLLQAVQAALQQIQPGEQVALLTYDVNVTLRSPLTSDLAAVRRSLDSIHPASVTAMHDAVFAGLSFGSPEVRSLLLLFTDGQDNASWLSASQVIESARRADVVVCPRRRWDGCPRPVTPCACRSTTVVVAGDGRALRADGRATLQSRSGEHDARGVRERADGIQVALPDCLRAVRRAE